MNESRCEGRGSSWLVVARRPEIVQRALRVASVVGTILVAIHYGDRFLAGTVSTYLVPYCVSTFTAVQMERESQ